MASPTLLQDVRDVTAYLNLVLGALGVLGNVACVRMMVSSIVSHISTTTFVIGAVLADVIVIVFFCASDVAYFLDDTDASDLLYGQASWRCKVGVFFLEGAKMLASWFIVAMAVEICLVYNSPSRQRVVYNSKRSLYVSSAILMVVLAASFPFLVISDTSTYGERSFCTSKYPLFYDFYKDFVLGVLVDYFIPVCFVTVCTIKQLLQLVQRSESRSVAIYDNDMTKDEVEPQFSNFILSISSLYLLCSIPTVVIRGAELLWRHSFIVHYWNSPANEYLMIAQLIANSLLLLVYCSKFYIAAFLEDDCSQALTWFFNFGKEVPSDGERRSYTRSGSYLDSKQPMRRRKKPNSVSF